MNNDDLIAGEVGGNASLSDGGGCSDFTGASTPSEAAGYSDASAFDASTGERSGGGSDPDLTGFGGDPLDTEYPAFADPSLFVDRYGYVRRRPGVGNGLVLFAAGDVA